MERNTPEGIHAWLSEEFSRPGWQSARVAQEISSEVLDMVLRRYDQYHQSAKVGILFSLLCIRKNDLLRLKPTMQKFFARAVQDTDNWVQTTAHILQDVPTDRKLNMNIEEWSASFGTLLTDLCSTVKEKGISFHANEYATMIPEAREDFVYGTDAFKANKPTLKRHFVLKTPPEQTARTKHRKQVLKALVDKERAELAATAATTPVSPTTPLMNSGMVRPVPGSLNGPATKRQALAPPSQNLFINRSQAAAAAAGGPRRTMVGGSQPPRPAPGANSLFNTRPQTRPMGAPGASSMFIPSRKGSLGGSTRPPPVRTVPPSASIGNNIGSPVPPTTPKGFQKQSRVQMVDFSESTRMLQDNDRNAKEAKEKEKAEKEAQKQENLLRRQREREENQRFKEKARVAKRQRVTSSTVADANSETPTSPLNHPSASSSPTMRKCHRRYSKNSYGGVRRA
ncbi:hypothetical protein BDB00DRAFT_828354 [Zychaea mexicana]|uniref:uncharacterized protein n=1 Tax=Zychaea mexicana TaxID=64656 RepID=UPI0022FDC1E5|nr:uncharacterized protein BDB00DRAFT_828354 [Zychaea mexicana]KAI9492465.1 hypothetical protein BDB00DRAFT_828354 [Zychaea mexicana]